MDLRQVRDYLYGFWVAREMQTFHKRGGKVVVITGSYGKTSVKELVYDLLRQKYEVVKTAGNYNTVVGIAKTLRYEVTKSTNLLILEVGAYRVGEITYFCKILKPDIGVITGIARQHLERFGSFENIIVAKTEIMRYLKDNGGILIANQSDETVSKVVKNALWYSGSERSINSQNGAKMIAQACGMSKTEIQSRLQYFRDVPSRFELTEKRYGMKVIDDSYNSNEKSFVQAVEYLGRQKNCVRVLVTPGLLELGNESNKIHEQLGTKILGNADLVILVGKNERTAALESGIGKKVKVLYIDKTLQFMALIKNLKLKKEPFVLLENDVPENIN